MGLLCRPFPGLLLVLGQFRLGLPAPVPDRRGLASGGLEVPAFPAWSLTAAEKVLSPFGFSSPAVFLLTDLTVQAHGLFSWSAIPSESCRHI